MKLEKNITLIRGDSWDLVLSILNKKTKEIIVLGEGDQLYFSIKNSYSSEEVLIQKRIGEGIVLGEDNRYHISIKPEENSKLHYMDYVYDVEVKIGSEAKKTKTIKRGTLKVDYEVTHLNNEV